MTKKTRKSRTVAARAKAIATAATLDEKEGLVKVERIASVGARLIHFGIIWFVVVGLTFAAKELSKRAKPLVNSDEGLKNQTTMGSLKETPPLTEVNEGDGSIRMLSSFGSYPNVLNITEDERLSFHAVVKFPKMWIDEIQADGRTIRKQIANYQVLDLTTMRGADQLASEEERIERRSGKKSIPQGLKGFAIGRYDENRVNLYTSALFDASNDIGGYDGARTLHIGIDLDGPLGTKVFSFTDGIIHKIGYNAELGDYGNVIVIEHHLHPDDRGDERKIYALYGHLDGKSIKGKKEGHKVKKGQLLGRMGDIHENGGWRLPHVHFQLSVSPPASHDMPGVVAVKDRARALLDYPDPRLVLGSLY